MKETGEAARSGNRVLALLLGCSDVGIRSPQLVLFLHFSVRDQLSKPLLLILAVALLVPTMVRHRGNIALSWVFWKRTLGDASGAVAAGAGAEDYETHTC